MERRAGQCPRSRRLASEEEDWAGSVVRLGDEHGSAAVVFEGNTL